MSTSIAAHPDRSLPTDPATREIARNPLEQVEDLPIVFPHGHVDARIIAENTPFPDPAQLLISPDHHVTRLTHANGVGMGLLNTMTWALKADTMEYGEYKTGIHTEGATYSAVWFTRKMGHEQLRPGEVPAPAGTRTDRPGPTGRDSHPMTTQGPSVPSERGDGSGPSTR